MAKLKSLKPKSKEFVFTAYGNDKDEAPAKIIFSRFPLPMETFTAAGKKDLFEGVDPGEISKRELKEKLTDKILNNFIENIYAGNIDFKHFFSECAEGFKDFEYEDEKIVTPADFWRILPQDAAHTIASEAYGYAMEREEFATGNSNA